MTEIQMSQINNPSEKSAVVTDVPKSSSPQSTLPIVVAIILSGFVFGGLGYLAGKTAVSSKKEIVESNLVQATPSTVPTQNPTATSSPIVLATPSLLPAQSLMPGWTLHKSRAGIYEVQVPVGWRIIGSEGLDEGFGPKEVQEDTLWGIGVYSKSSNTLAKIAAPIGDQFEDRNQTSEPITVNGYSATKIVTTTGKYDGWYSETIVFDAGDSYIAFSNGAMSDETFHKVKGVKPGVTFEKFYQSFRLLK